MGELDKRRKEAEWREDHKPFWTYNGYIVARVPGHANLCRVLNEDGTPSDLGRFTTRQSAFAAIDAAIAGAAKGKVK